MQVAVGGRGPFALVRFDGNRGRVFGEVDDFGNFAGEDFARHRRLMVVRGRWWWLLVLRLLLCGLHGPLEFVEGRWVQLAGKGAICAGHGLLPHSLPHSVVGVDSDYLKNILC